jgi:hypothetical protein
MFTTVHEFVRQWARTLRDWFLSEHPNPEYGKFSEMESQAILLGILEGEGQAIPHTASDGTTTWTATSKLTDHGIRQGEVLAVMTNATLH